MTNVLINLRPICIGETNELYWGGKKKTYKMKTGRDELLSKWIYGQKDVARIKHKIIILALQNIWKMSSKQYNIIKYNQKIKKQKIVLFQRNTSVN